MTKSTLQAIKDWDARRPNLPGEHWLTLAGGIGLWLKTRQHPRLAVRLAGSVIGSMMVARAATGRQGLGRYRWIPLRA